MMEDVSRLYFSSHLLVNPPSLQDEKLNRPRQEIAQGKQNLRFDTFGISSLGSSQIWTNDSQIRSVDSVALFWWFPES